jgi:hypothetical protein
VNVQQKLPVIPTTRENSIKIPTPTCTGPGTLFLENRERNRCLGQNIIIMLNVPANKFLFRHNCLQDTIINALHWNFFKDQVTDLRATNMDLACNTSSQLCKIVLKSSMNAKGKDWAKSGWNFKIYAFLLRPNYNDGCVFGYINYGSFVKI